MFLYSGLKLHMISTNYPLSFIMTLFYSVISAYKYNPGTSNIATYSFSIASITSAVISGFVDTVGDYMFSLSIRNRFCLLLSGNVLPLIFPLIFLLIKFTASSSPLFYLIINPYGLIAPNTGFSSIAP